MTRQALQAIAVLALEQVDDETVISHPINLPFFLRGDLWGQRLQSGFSLGRHFHWRRFVLNTIQILVQPVQNEREELLRIMLICPGELLGKADDLFLLSVGAILSQTKSYAESNRREESVILLPQRFQ